MSSDVVLSFALMGLLFNIPLIGRAQRIVAKYNDSSKTILITREPQGAPKDPVDTLTVFYPDGQKVKTYSLDVEHISETTLKKKHLEGTPTEFGFDSLGMVKFKNGSSREVYFCKDKKCFSVGSCADVAAKPPKDTIKNKGGIMSPDFPFPPQFSPDSDSIPGNMPNDSAGYYHLVIDANPNIAHKRNNTLYVKKIKGDATFYKISKWLKAGSSLSVFISNYNFALLENINLSINGRDYHYEQGIQNIYDSVLPKETGEKDTSVEAAEGVAFTAVDSSMILISQLKWTLEYLNKYTSLNINDMVLLNEYKANLRKFFTDHSDKFNKEGIGLLNQILVWSPWLVSLGPIATAIPDSDEVAFELKIKDKGVAEKSYSVATYFVKGKASVTAGGKGSLFFTNLKNKEAYIDSADHKARLDDSHCLSIGVGASGIVSFRTGSAYTPSINLGFFVPLGEDLSPFGHIGPGINYGTKKVGLNLSAGLAFGKVNAIKSWYKDIDMRTIQNLDPMGITYKEWSLGWSVSFGLSFNIAK